MPKKKILLKFLTIEKQVFIIDVIWNKISKIRVNLYYCYIVININGLIDGVRWYNRLHYSFKPYKKISKNFIY